MRRRRRDPFPPDRGLQARMILAAVATPVIVFACLAALAALAPMRVDIGVAIAALVGIGMVLHDRAQRPAPKLLTETDAPALHATVDRLCVLADLPKPEIVLENERQANSWLVGVARGRYRLHVTRGLLDLLTPEQLEAVVAHELAHAVNRDAAVMTVVGGPGAILLAGGSRIARTGFWVGTIGGVLAAGIGWLSRLGTQILSRHRELSADAAAVALTGRPAALASALRAVSGQIALVPVEDLRVAAGRDAFHLLPVARHESRWTATHPPLEVRIERLERMERVMRSARMG
jgi:heat shock protein HtpX